MANAGSDDYGVMSRTTARQACISRSVRSGAEGAAQGQCDMSTGTVIDCRMPRVAPPKTSSRKRECPYPPITRRSAPESWALERSPLE